MVRKSYKQLNSALTEDHIGMNTTARKITSGTTCSYQKSMVHVVVK